MFVKDDAGGHGVPEGVKERAATAGGGRGSRFSDDAPFGRRMKIGGTARP